MVKADTFFFPAEIESVFADIKFVLVEIKKVSICYYLLPQC
ncbi:hypothetical protein [Niallia hominis]